jgi:hypothetical protein
MWLLEHTRDWDCLIIMHTSLHAGKPKFTLFKKTKSDNILEPSLCDNLEE